MAAASFVLPSGRPAGGSGGTGARGYSPIFGGVPNLPTATGTQTNVSNILNQAIPGFSGLTQSATTQIDDLMNGRLPQGVINEIQDAGAAQAVAGGMPGNSREFGGVFGNSVLRNIGSAAEGRKQQGFQDLLALLQGYSGTAALTPEQTQDQENARAIYASAPLPAYAIPYMQNQYQQASRPSAGTSGGGGGGAAPRNPWAGVVTDVWQNGMRGTRDWATGNWSL